MSKQSRLTKILIAAMWLYMILNMIVSIYVVFFAHFPG